MQFATLQDHLAADKLSGIDLVAELGFDGLELIVPDGIHEVGSHGMSLNRRHQPIEDDLVFSQDGRKQLRSRAEPYDLEFPSICPSFMNMRPGLIASDTNEREVAIGHLESLIEAAEPLGAHTILVPFFIEAEIETDAHKRNVVDSLSALAPTAAAAGVTLAIETTLDARANRALLEEIDHAAVALYYDVANVINFGYNPAPEIRELGEHIQQVHFKTQNQDGDHALLADGVVDFEAVADALAAIEYDRWIVLETSYVDDPTEAMAANLAYARAMLRDAGLLST